MDDASRYPLNKICKAWLEKLRLAKKFKKEHFQDDADTAMKFFQCGRELNDHLWRDRLRNADTLMDNDDDALPAPRFRILVGKVAELVQLFGPSLYHRNPTIVVEPKELDIPLDVLMDMTPPEQIQQAQMQAQQMGQQFNPESLYPQDPAGPINKVVALLLQFYLDYMQRENDKKTHSRRMIDEALIKGMGVLWTEQYEPYEGGPTLIGSFYDSVDNLLIDPDAETIEECTWVARRCLHPIWQVAKEYGLKESFLKGKYGTGQSLEGRASSVVDDDADRKRQTGESNDLIEYWKIYSKMGMGHKLKGVKELDDGLDEYLDKMGMNCYIVVAAKVPYPLNLPPSHLKKAMQADPDDTENKHSEKAFMGVQWPIPFWADGSWPFTHLAFHEVPNQPWPMSHIKPGLGYLEFVTWCMSFLVNRIRTSCRTVVSAMKALEDELQAQLFSGKDFSCIKIPQNLVPDGDVSKAVHFFEVPPVHGDTWKVLEAAIGLFEKATGLNDLLYGSQGGFRSAAEANIKSGNTSVRPDDMANKVEDCMSLIARKEAMAARWLLNEEQVFPVLGQRGAQLWQNYVMTGDIDKVAREFHYRVEAGSTRKPNKETRVVNINNALQQWAPLIQWALQTGNVNTVNAFIKSWCEANDMEAKPFLLPPPPPPPPDPNQMKIEAEIQLKQKEFELKQQESQNKLEFDKQKLQLELAAEHAKMQAEMQKAEMQMQLKKAETEQKLQLSQMEMQGKMHMQEQQMHMDQQKMQAEMQMAQQQGAQELHLNATKNAQQMQLESSKTSQQLQLESAKTKQQLAMGAQEHQLGMQQQKAAGAQKLKQGQAESKVKVDTTKQMAKAKADAAKAKPKPKPKGKK